MITSLFRKSTPFNYALVILLVLIFFFLYQFHHTSLPNSVVTYLQKAGLLALLLGSHFTINFIGKKNGLSRESAYIVLFYLLFLLFFPSVLDNTNLIISNFFILLAFRRLISLQSPMSSKEKIFDASLWVFVAALFHFWSILFILLIFISILFNVARDYRNWVIPFIAFFAVSIIFILLSTIFDKNLVNDFLQSTSVNYKLDYFVNNYQNSAFSLYTTIALFFVVSLILTLSKRPVMLHSSYKKILSYFFIGIVVFLISSHKSNDILLFTIAPLSIMATAQIEAPQAKIRQEIVLFVLIGCSLFAFFSQLQFVTIR